MRGIERKMGRKSAIYLLRVLNKEKERKSDARSEKKHKKYLSSLAVRFNLYIRVIRIGRPSQRKWKTNRSLCWQNVVKCSWNRIWRNCPVCLSAISKVFWRLDTTYRDWNITCRAVSDPIPYLFSFVSFRSNSPFFCFSLIIMMSRRRELPGTRNPWSLLLDGRQKQWKNLMALLMSVNLWFVIKKWKRGSGWSASPPFQWMSNWMWVGVGWPEWKSATRALFLSCYKIKS